MLTRTSAALALLALASCSPGDRTEHRVQEPSAATEAGSLPKGEIVVGEVTDGGRWFLRGGVRMLQVNDRPQLTLAYSGVARVTDQGMFGLLLSEPDVDLARLIRGELSVLEQDAETPRMTYYADGQPVTRPILTAQAQIDSRRRWILLDLRLGAADAPGMAATATASIRGSLEVDCMVTMVDQPSSFRMDPLFSTQFCRDALTRLGLAGLVDTRESLRPLGARP